MNANPSIFLNPRLSKPRVPESSRGQSRGCYIGQSRGWSNLEAGVQAKKPKAERWNMRLLEDNKIVYLLVGKVKLDNWRHNILFVTDIEIDGENRNK